MILFDINSAKLDSSLDVDKATLFFYKAFQLIPRETEGLSIYEIGNGRDIPDADATRRGIA
jgi:hypothetical protein